MREWRVQEILHRECNHPRVFSKTTCALLKTRCNIKVVVRNQITYFSVRNRGNGFVFCWQDQCTFRNVKREQSELGRRYVRFDVADGGTNLLILQQCTMRIVLPFRWSITKLARLPRRREKKDSLLRKEGWCFLTGISIYVYIFLRWTDADKRMTDKKRYESTATVSFFSQA